MQAEKTNPSQTLEEIFAELRQEGKAEGKEEGKEEGRKDALKQFVQTLIRENYSDEQIAKLTKLDSVQIEKLRNSFKN